MITIFESNWNENAKCDGTLPAQEAAAKLRADGWHVVIRPCEPFGGCVGAECDTDQEDLALLKVND